MGHAGSAKSAPESRAEDEIPALSGRPRRIGNAGACPGFADGGLPRGVPGVGLDPSAGVIWGVPLESSRSIWRQDPRRLRSEPLGSGALETERPSVKMP